MAIWPRIGSFPPGRSRAATVATRQPFDHRCPPRRGHEGALHARPPPAPPDPLVCHLGACRRGTGPRGWRRGHPRGHLGSRVGRLRSQCGAAGNPHVGGRPHQERVQRGDQASHGRGRLGLGAAQVRHRVEHRRPEGGARRRAGPPRRRPPRHPGLRRPRDPRLGLLPARCAQHRQPRREVRRPQRGVLPVGAQRDRCLHAQGPRRRRSGEHRPHPHHLRGQLRAALPAGVLLLLRPDHRGRHAGAAQDRQARDEVHEGAAPRLGPLVRRRPRQRGELADVGRQRRGLQGHLRDPHARQRCAPLGLVGRDVATPARRPPGPGRGLVPGGPDAGEQVAGEPAPVRCRRPLRLAERQRLPLHRPRHRAGLPGSRRLVVDALGLLPGQALWLRRRVR